MKGLARFDGASFTRFDQLSMPELSTSPIVFLFEDSRENLWVGTRSDGVVLIRAGQAIRIDVGTHSRDGYLVSAAEAEDGTVWLYTADGQLCRYSNGRLDVWPVGAGRPSRTRDVVAEKPGRVWVGMESDLLGIGSENTNNLSQLPPVESIAVEGLDLLLASKMGGRWQLANGRVQKWRGTELIKDYGAYPWQDPLITAACEDPQGNLVVGTHRSGAYWFDAEGRAQRLTGLPDDQILSLCFDREGDLWVGTDGGGLNRVRRSQFSTLPGTENWVVQSVSPDEDGGLWIGCNGGELAHWRRGELQSYATSQDVPSVKAVLLDREQRVWVGTWGRGLFNLEAGRFQPIVAVGLFQAAVIAIHEDRSGTLWLGLQETSPDTHDGLARIRQGQLTFLTTDDGLPPGAVRALADDATGSLWIGTDGGGLARLRDESVTRFRMATGHLPSDTVSALLMDEEGTLWIGTDGGGLASLRDGKWKTFNKRDGLTSNSIGYLLEDDQGYLWLGSDAGLMRISKAELNAFEPGKTNVLPCRVYDKADGLPTRECTFGSQPAACRTQDGRLWFPTIMGLVSVDPAKLVPNPVPPPVVIESIRIDQQEQMTNALSTLWPQRVTLVPGNQLLEIAYTSLNLAARDRTRFRYRLEGYDPAWTDAGPERIARYPQLPPGDYTFRVTAANEDGLWSVREAVLGVTVKPPFWRTLWFMVLSAGAVIGLIAGSVYYISTQRLQGQLAALRQKEALEKERARIARDLHDQLGANLTQISLLGELAEVDKDLPEEVEEHSRQICKTSRETTRALDEIVWAANPSNDTLEGLINYVCKYAQEYLALAGLRYRLEVPSPLPAVTLPPELRHHVFLAAKEAVNNVVKHAQASEARLSLKLEPTRFTLEIADNGRGPAGKDTKAAKSRNGLRNMRKRMEDMGGHFSLEPAPGGGSIVRLTAPLKKGYH
jgi:signal transduction histidine kinase/ligand-binding sensor domain-containing protein